MQPVTVWLNTADWVSHPHDTLTDIVAEILWNLNVLEVRSCSCWICLYSSKHLFGLQQCSKAIRICRQLWFRSYLDLLQSKADCIPVSEMVQRFHLHSTAVHLWLSARRAVVPSELVAFRHSLYSVQDWNSLPRLLRDTSHYTTSFGHSLKTFFLSEY